MRNTTLTHLLIGLAMLASAGLAIALKPAVKLTSEEAKVDLETMVPKSFGPWKFDTTIVPIMINPELKKVVEATYSQTLTRTYVDDQGRRIMLSIAYGGNHGEGMQTHRPEICYPAQGFQIIKEQDPQALHTEYGNLTVKKLVAEQGPRIEPITYWVVVGDIHTGFGLPMKLAQLRYNLTGVIPDGMLVRVSSIDEDNDRAFKLQESFIDAMLHSIDQRNLVHITGKFNH
jgi:EpsI family protein